MPGRRERGDGAEYVLVLREHDDAARGYSLELTPLLGGVTLPRAHGRGSTGEAAGGTAPLADHGGVLTREAAMGTATSGSPAREAGTGADTASRAHRSSHAREAGTGTASRAQAGSPKREAATETGAGRASLARGSSPTREAATGPPSARGGSMANSHGGHTRVGAAAQGGDSSGERGDAAGGADLFVDEYDPAGAARERILKEMRDMILSPSQGGFTPPKISDADSKSAIDTKSVREVLIPVFLSPKKREKDDKEDDDTWNKRQIMYIFVLTTTAGRVFLLQPLLPAAFGRWIIMIIAAAWGAASVGLPCGLHGTARCEKECSRHVGRFVYTLFAVLVIYGFYLAAMHIDSTTTPAPSPSLKEGGIKSAANSDEFWWVCFGLIGVSVLFGNLWSSVRGFSNAVGLAIFVLLAVPMAARSTNADEVGFAVFFLFMSIYFPALGYACTWNLPEET